jgi:putative PEP-CTERM system histidine kinase
MLFQISLWSHAVAAILFGALSVWIGQQALSQRSKSMMAIACAATAFWALTLALAGATSIVATLGEGARNIAWIAYLYGLWRQGVADKWSSALASVYGVILLVILTATTIGIAPLIYSQSPRVLEATFYATLILGMIISIGALVLVHSLYTAATNETRDTIRLPMIALAVMWLYDLNLCTIAYLSSGISKDMLALRGAELALLAPLFGLSVQHGGRVAMRLSRSATFQSLSLVAIGAYLTTMILLTSAIKTVAGEYTSAAQIVFVFGTSISTLILLPSERFRAWFNVKIAKHLFQHRYDYRAEWLRFTDTIGRPGEVEIPLNIRIVKAIADVTESSGGLLLIPDQAGTLIGQNHWNWDNVDVPTPAASKDVAQYYGKSGRIVELDAVRSRNRGSDQDINFVPEWLLIENDAWAIVPLVHFEKLAGLVILRRPKIDRTLDWEDFDLLRVVGRQVASYLSEAGGQEALAHAQQFDEFNRRFAFIIHDIKNLVSQLSLMTRNAERHVGNPAFQVDMIATLKNSTARMNDMLARLSQHNKVKPEDPQVLVVGPVLERIAAVKRVAHPIVLSGDLNQFVIADSARLEQAVAHLVQNAIDASDPAEPVILHVHRIHENAIIEVQDHGVGMSSHFMSHQLFKPFASTKQDGFGIGAFEARALITAMGGRVEVNSQEGRGSVFRIVLPTARGPAFRNLEEQALTP